MPTENPRAEEAFAFYVSLDPKERKYAVVAEKFGVSLPTVKLWASRGKWRKRVAKREARVARRVADTEETREVGEKSRNLKLVQLAIIKLAKAITDGDVRPTYNDFRRFIELAEALENPETATGGPQQVVVTIIRGEANAAVTTLPGGEDDGEPG